MDKERMISDLTLFLLKQHYDEFMKNYYNQHNDKPDFNTVIFELSSAYKDLFQRIAEYLK